MLDERLYTYQFRKPRLSNRTYNSVGVGNSITYFMNPKNSELSQSSYKPQQIKPENPSIMTQQSLFVANPQRGNSNLSQYGSKSLEITERDIYHKQNPDFNIISLKPKEYRETIKKYPKYSLENQDSYYYRRMRQIQQQSEIYKSLRESSVERTANNPSNEGKLKKYEHDKYFAPKMLNQADEVAQLI